MKRALAGLAALGGVVALLARARAWSAVRVAGGSMAPTLLEGELLAARPPFPHEPRPGQIVVARVGDREVVKRVGVPDVPLAAGEFWLVGDDPSASTDSRTTGPVVRDAIVGVVRARYWPLWRARVLRE